MCDMAAEYTIQFIDDKHRPQLCINRWIARGRQTTLSMFQRLSSASHFVNAVSVTIYLDMASARIVDTIIETASIAVNFDTICID